ncbi:MAG: threonylcarbamoyladenosine tRNA methylthiotransferase MtaB, partial [Acidobacteriaceae bacterium]
HISRARNKILRDLAAEKKRVFMQSLIGKPLPAITLNVLHRSAESEFTEALTDNYQKLYLKQRYDPNQWIMAHVEHIDGEALVGATLDSLAS